jgi:hypothetical protein
MHLQFKQQQTQFQSKNVDEPQQQSTTTDDDDASKSSVSRYIV